MGSRNSGGNSGNGGNRGGSGGGSQDKARDDNRSGQLNPESDKYWQSRGDDGRPENWRERLEGQGE